ncbi:MAG: hypothetical protein V1904_08005 [Bacteroidota bacterium]
MDFRTNNILKTWNTGAESKADFIHKIQAVSEESNNNNHAEPMENKRYEKMNPEKDSISLLNQEVV